MNRIIILRIIHAIFALYFMMCLVYLYYSGIIGNFDWLVALSVISLGIEGFLIFILNEGNCPLIHVQRRIGDPKPFFELFFPAPIAKQAIPLFAKLTWLAVAVLLIRFVVRLCS